MQHMQHFQYLPLVQVRLAERKTHEILDLTQIDGVLEAEKPTGCASSFISAVNWLESIFPRSSVSETDRGIPAFYQKKTRALNEPVEPFQRNMPLGASCREQRGNGERVLFS